jgi:hypothetical protein
VATRADDGGLAIDGITAAGGVLIAAVATRDADGPLTHSTPTGMVRVAKTGNAPGLSTFWQNIGVGATGTRTSTIAGATYSQDNGGILIAIKP